MTFSIYGEAWKGNGPTLEEIVAHQQEHRDLWANAEQSGSEGCYCEVARWNEQKQCWQRWAFCKFLGGEVKELPEAKSYELAEHVAGQINQPVGHFPSVVHSMENFAEPEAVPVCN